MKIAVALSGGVDSAVAAALLQAQGHAVTGFFMKNWTDVGSADYRQPTAADCPWQKDYQDAQAVCQKLGIDCNIVHFEKEYRQQVLDYFLQEYRYQRTPNPDVVCNTTIKFDAFWQYAKQQGFNVMATGHYARIEQRNQQWLLRRGLDPNKDQSYFIHHLTQEQLAHIQFPLGNMRKDAVRDLARQYALPVADKPDSQGLCFIGKIDFPAFLEQYFKPQPGPIITTEGDVIGQHRGLEWYTIGQRYGLAIGGTGPYYVVAKRPNNNSLVVCQGLYHPALYHDRFIIANEHWIAGEPLAKTWRSLVQVRYRSSAVPGRVYHNLVMLDYPIRAITPGQFAVFYRGDVVLGGATINQILD